MSPKQKMIAGKAPPPNKIDAKDFAVLRAEKAKDRGMGLQDEKVQPGKVMKAKRGRLFQGYLSTFDASAEASTPKAQRGVTTIVGVRPGAKIGKGKKKFKSMEAMRAAKGFKTIDGKQETSSEFNKRRMKLAGAAKAAKASRVGKIALGVATAGVAAQQYLKSKMNKKKDVKKKMGGGMMQKPMGYNTGGFKSKEARKKAEKNIKTASRKEALKSFLSDSPRYNQPMRKDRYMEGKKARHTEFKKKIGRTALGIASTLNPVTAIAKGIKKVIKPGKKKRDFQKGDYGDISVKKNMGGMMMQRPMGYKQGTEPGAGPLGGIRKRKAGSLSKRKAGRPALSSVGRQAGPSQPRKQKEDSSVTLAKFLKASVAGTNESIKGGGMRAERATEGSGYRNKRGFRKDVEAGKYKANKDAAYYKSIGLTGKRGDQAVEDFYKPYHMRSDAIKLKSGGMTKPMGYKHGTSVTAKCKLGRNKPTKIT